MPIRINALGGSAPPLMLGGCGVARGTSVGFAVGSISSVTTSAGVSVGGAGVWLANGRVGVGEGGSPQGPVMTTTIRLKKRGRPQDGILVLLFSRAAGQISRK